MFEKISTGNTVQYQAVCGIYTGLYVTVRSTLHTKCRNEKNFVWKHTVWIVCFVAKNLVTLIFDLSRDNYLSKLINVEHLQCISTVVLLQQTFYFCEGCCPHTGDLRIIHDRADNLHHSLRDILLLFGDNLRNSLSLRIRDNLGLIVGISNN